MEVVINGKKTETNCCYLQELVAGQQGQTLLYNGYQTEENLPLQAGDQIVILPRGVMPDRESWESMLAARHTPPVHEHIRQGAVAIAGLGGLGSHIAVMLARAGIGKLLLVDFDTVEISNLNRQHYTVRHLGMPKTEALAMQLQEINPFVNYLLGEHTLLVVLYKYAVLPLGLYLLYRFRHKRIAVLGIYLCALCFIGTVVYQLLMMPLHWW